MIHTAEVKLKIVDVDYRRSPLIRGGLEIPVEVIVKMVNNCKNKEAVTKYTEQKYKEPVDGKYEDISATVLASKESDDDDDEESDDEIKLPPP